MDKQFIFMSLPIDNFFAPILRVTTLVQNHIVHADDRRFKIFSQFNA